MNWAQWLRCLLVAGIAANIIIAQARAIDGPTVPLDELLSDIQQALIKVRDASDTDNLPPLTAVQLTLRATLTQEGGASLKFHILDANFIGSDERVQELRLTLKPPQEADQSPTAAAVMPLADAIIDAARSVKKAMTREPPLHLNTLEASVEFTVEKGASGSILFFGGKGGTRNAQQIILTFRGNQ
jgi:hypothetical protein